MKDESVIFSAPPRLLLGVGFLFWGAMLDTPFLGLIGALLMEARYWTNLRWKFGEGGFAKAWQLSVLLLVVSAVVKMGSEEDRVESAVTVLSMLPYVFLPLMLAQQYASDRGVPLTTFSFVARRKMAKDRAAGREVRVLPCQLGYPYLGLILISSGLGVNDLKWYGIGVTVLMACILHSMKKGEGVRRPRAWILAFGCAIFIAGGISGGTYWAYGKFKRATASRGQSHEHRGLTTALGNVGKLKLNPAIVWRYQHKGGSRPARLRMAAYDTFAYDRWTKRLPSRAQRRVSEERDAGGGLVRLFSSEEKKRKDHAYREDDLSFEGPLLGTLRGQVKDSTLLPIPPTSRRFLKVAADELHVNGLGTTEVSDPDQGSIELNFVAGEKRVFEEDPTEFDLVILPSEVPGMERFWKQEGEILPKWIHDIEDSDDLVTSKKILERVDLPVIENLRPDLERQTRLWAKIQNALRKKNYTLDLKPKKKEPPVTDFIHSMDAGHCEYFASAATLLLRRAGIPSRYVVGYAVDERGKNPGEWILRGKHAHAWCQAYLGGTWRLEPSTTGIGGEVWRCRRGRWVEIDLTPGAWLEMDTAETGWRRRLADWWQVFTEDIVLWFGRPKVIGVLKFVMWFSGAFLLLWIINRLWRTRTRKSKVLKGSWEERCVDLRLLRDLEKWLKKRNQVRPVGVPVGEWLGMVYPTESAALVKKYQTLKFDPQPPAGDLKQEIEEFKKTVRAQSRKM